MLKERLEILEVSGILPKNAIKEDPSLYLNPKSIHNLTLNDNEESFNEIIAILLTNNIIFLPTVSMFFYRLFSMDSNTLKHRIEEFKSVDEIDYIRQNPHVLANASTSEELVRQIVTAKSKQENYKYIDEDGYIGFEFRGEA